MTEELTPAKVQLTDGLGVTVGDGVMLRADLYEGADECHPGGYLAKRGEKLIVRTVREHSKFPLSVSHEGRADGLTFSVSAAEVRSWVVTPNARGKPRR